MKDGRQLALKRPMKVSEHQPPGPWWPSSKLCLSYSESSAGWSRQTQETTHCPGFEGPRWKYSFSPECLIEMWLQQIHTHHTQTAECTGTVCKPTFSLTDQQVTWPFLRPTCPLGQWPDFLSFYYNSPFLKDRRRKDAHRSRKMRANT